MSVVAKRAGRGITLEFVGAEIIESWGPPDEMYGDGSIVLTANEALELAMEILQAVKEIMDDGDEEE